MCSIFSFALLWCSLCFGPFGLPLAFLSVLCFRSPLLCSLWYATEFYSRWFTPSLAVCSLCPYRSCLLTPKLLCRFVFLSSSKKIAPREWFFYFILIYRCRYKLKKVAKYLLFIFARSILISGRRSLTLRELLIRRYRLFASWYPRLSLFSLILYQTKTKILIVLCWCDPKCLFVPLLHIESSDIDWLVDERFSFVWWWTV